MALLRKNIYKLFAYRRIQGWKCFSSSINKWNDDLSSQIKKEIEKQWNHCVLKNNRELATPSDKPKFYALSMFPYPSGKLHMGHVRVYSISDAVARFHQMNGMQVIHPMGWDSFGLPAENAALDKHVAPQKWTEENIAKMKSQLIQLGCSFDWDRELNTSSPEYYKWTQFLFLQLYKNGLVYKKEAYVNWDPVDKTVLADEQVDINSCSWRSGAKVEKKLLNQWFIKTTVFAKQLYDGLDDPILVDWKDIIQMQKHWIGECNGITVDFNLLCDTDKIIKKSSIPIWTDRPESLLHCHFVAVPPNSILDKIDYVEYENEKFKLLSIMAHNPITEKNLPIFVTNEIVFAEGSEAHLGSPDIDDEDLQFIIQTKIPYNRNAALSNMSLKELHEMRNTICEIAKDKNIGGYPVSSKLKDWLISRQRYWGTPIPIVNCEICGIQPVPLDQLPVVLPDIQKYSRTGISPLSDIEHWINTVCPGCGGKATRETDTMDTFVDSSWYYLRFLDPKNDSLPFGKNSVSNMPVDIYIGGKEHAVLHLYYARFMSHFLQSIGLIPEKEPFKRLLVQGMVMGKSYKIKDSGQYIPESSVKIVNVKKGTAVTKDSNKPVEIFWEKMSKSKYNGVDPSDLFEEYGCDTTRLFILADVSPVSNRHWSNNTFPGVLNWQHRLWLAVGEFRKERININNVENEKIVQSKDFQEQDKKMWDSLNYFVTSITFNFQYTNQLSVAISRLQGLTNSLRKAHPNIKALSKNYEYALASQIIMLSPLAPHFSCELWEGFISADGRIQNDDSLIAWNKNVLEQNWPKVHENYKLDLICTINGHEFGRLKLLPIELNNLNEQKALDLVLQSDIYGKYKTKAISDTSLSLYPNCKAMLTINTVQKPKIQQEICSDVAQ